MNGVGGKRWAKLSTGNIDSVIFTALILNVLEKELYLAEIRKKVTRFNN